MATRMQICMLLFTYNIILFSKSPADIQYCLINYILLAANGIFLSIQIKPKQCTMVFKVENRRDNMVFHYNKRILENVSCFTYLGVTFTSNGKFFQTQKS